MRIEFKGKVVKVMVTKQSQNLDTVTLWKGNRQYEMTTSSHGAYYAYSDNCNII